METQVWIVAQVGIDIIIFILLLILLRFYKKQRVSFEDFETAAQKSEKLLNEMKEIGSVLEKNLIEKRELTRALYSEIDKRMAEAKEASDRLRKSFKDYGKVTPKTDRDKLETGVLRDSIEKLELKGLSTQEIARHLKVPVGELELIMKLQTPEGQRKVK